MDNEKKKNGLTRAGLVGRSIVKCDDQKCDTCGNERFDCVKLTAPGGHVCLWK